MTQTVARPVVLVVDDEPDIRELMQIVLEEEGYAVRTASDGRSALAQCALSPIHLILLDMRMAGMDGWEFARVYQACPKRAPIVVVTAAESAAQRAADIGAEAYLGKPFGLDELMATVATYIRR